MRPLTRSASLTNYATVARAAGLDPIEMLRKVGIDPSGLSEPDIKVPADQALVAAQLDALKKIRASATDAAHQKALDAAIASLQKG